jgi:hypothetical protein
VAAGLWLDPYTGESFRDPGDIQIDHVVALKNAHDSGAWAWTAARRREYANYLEYDQHLLAVKGVENNRKSDKGPDQYLPPLESYRCQYVRLWVQIKEDWVLNMSDAEAAAVQKVLASCP